MRGAITNTMKWKTWSQWNKGKKLVHKKIKNLDLEKIKNLIKKGKSSVEIAKKLKVSYPTILKYVKLKLEEKFFIELKQNGRNNKKHFKDGRGIYRRFKHDKCQKCGSIENLEVHHIQPGTYNKNYTKIIEGNHSPNNLITLCNSCHQKVHYRELGKKHMVNHSIKTGRFIRKVNKNAISNLGNLLFNTG